MTMAKVVVNVDKGKSVTVKHISAGIDREVVEVTSSHSFDVRPFEGDNIFTISPEIDVPEIDESGNPAHIAEQVAQKESVMGKEKEVASAEKDTSTSKASATKQEEKSASSTSKTSSSNKK